MNDKNKKEEKENLYLYSQRYQPLSIFKNIPILKNKSREELIRSIKSYLLAIGSISLACTVSILLNQYFAIRTPLLIFLVAVILSAWYGGFKAGILSTILATVYYVIFYFTPIPSSTTPPIIQLVIFVGVCFLISYILEKNKKENMREAYLLREKAYALELSRLNDELIKAQDEVRARDEFLSITSHELKTPLTSMLLQLQTVIHNLRHVSLAEFSIANLMKMLESGETQVKRLSKMINDMLNVSLITTGRLELENEEVDLKKLTQEIVDSFQERLNKEGYKVQVNVPNFDVVGNWDKLRIEQAISNLISNAIKYGKHKPIIIQVSGDDENATFSIEDHGIGISDDKVKMIFDRFSRGVSEKEYKGLGIGLYITKQIVERHGGTVDVLSKQGKTIFTITLPKKISKSDNV